MKTKLVFGMLLFAAHLWSQSREIQILPEKLNGYLQQNIQHFSLPVGPNGADVVFSLKQTHVMHPDLEARYPEIKTYVGYDKQNPVRQITLTKTNNNIRAVINDKGVLYRFEPKNGNLYEYYREEPFSDDACGLAGKHHPEETVKALWPASGYGTTKYHIDKMLIPLSGNFAIDHNITTLVDGLAYTANCMNYVSAKYEMEIGITFELHPDQDQLIFLNASDPYPDYPTSHPSQTGGANSFIERNQVICDSIIGNANYSLAAGLFRTSVAWGIYTAVCGVSNKAKLACFNGMNNMCHEIGHGFTIGHTYSLTPDGSPYIESLEPTTMGGSGDYFACTSVERLAEWAIAGNNLTCATQSPSGNAAPQMTATVDGKYMPANTPFVLSNTSVTDANAGQTLLYSWQSTDGCIIDQYGDSAINSPEVYMIFAAERPSPTGNIRYVPYLDNLISGDADRYSYLPWVTRDMHVRCLVRDSAGGVNMTFETVHVDGNSGPFKVNTPVAGDVVTELQTITVNWDIAGTTAAPVSAANVEILLSIDGGVTFPVVLTASTPNDGSQAVTIPNGTATANARVMVKGNGIFFNINPSPFRIYDNALPPDYAVYAYDTLKHACSSSVSYEFIAQQLGGYSNPVTFSVSNLPAGVTSNFPQTINPGQHVNLVLSSISTSMRGIHHFTLTASSTSGVKTSELDLVVAGQIQTTNNYAMSAISTTATGRNYSIPDLTWDPAEFTIEYWIKFDSAAMGVNSSAIYWGASGNNYLRKVSNDKIVMQITDHSYYQNSVSSIDPVLPNRWYHIAGTSKHKKVDLYVDGVHQGQDGGDLGPLFPWTSVSVGRNGTQGLTGELDEFRIWNKCLTEEEIRDRMHLNLSPEDVCSGNVEVYLQFEQDSSAVYDVTGNHTVALVNAPSSTLSDCPTASGVSVRKTVSSTGAVSFDNALADTDLDITFNANPNGEVVAYKLQSIPNGTQPSFMDLNENAFWIVRNFGDTSLSYNATLNFTDAAFNLSPTAGNYSIKQRQSFKAMGSWSNATIGSSYASNEVGFSGFNKFGHFAYGIDDDLSVSELTNDSWLLYPNPTDSKVTLLFQDASSKQLVIENTFGQLVWEASVEGLTYEVNLEKLSAGVYYVRLTEGTETSLKRIVIK